MVFEIVAKDAANAYDETLGLLRSCGKTEDSRNGPVVTLQEPFILTLKNPLRRVLLDPIRNANPFFHVMEAIWMFAGEQDITWIKHFNSRMEEFSENNIMHGAYGYRWLRLWGDQIHNVIGQLRKDLGTRQAVISMWDPGSDHLDWWKDRPCNTQIYFRTVDGKLNMTVTNRSNDVIWGMLGSNIVHMTMLHEIIATAVGIPVGIYRVFTNNLHFYTKLYSNGNRIWDNLVETPTPYPCQHYELLYGVDSLVFFEDCGYFVKGKYDWLRSPWLKYVAKSMFDAYFAKTHQARLAHANLIEADDWRRASTEWLERANERQERNHR